MVRAAAVAAVRRGLRTAFCRASLPGVPNSLPSTGPTSAITGRESSGSRTKTPISARAAPRPTGARPESLPVEAP